MTSASDLTELWRTIYDLGSGSGSVPAPCKISSLYRIFGSVCFLLPVSSVAGAGASLNHQTLEHFCHHDQGLWQDQSPSALYQQRQVESAAGRSRRACRSWEWGPPPTAWGVPVWGFLFQKFHYCGGRKNLYTFTGRVSIEVTEISCPLSPVIKWIESYEVLVKKSIQARMKSIIPVAILTSKDLLSKVHREDWSWKSILRELDKEL